MRRLAMAAVCAAVCGSGTVASATDLSLKDTPVFTPAPAPVWSGLYIGGHLGGLWTSNRTASALEQVCRTPPGGGGEEPGGEDPGEEEPGGEEPGGHDDCDNNHPGENHDDHKHGKKHGKRGKGGKQDKSSPVRMSVAATPANPSTPAPAAPVCTDFTKSSNVVFEDDKDDVSLIAGVHVGYNWHRQSALVGVEADVDFADGFDYLASLRGRLGYVAGDFLIYATAGVAIAASSDTTFNFKTPLASYSFDRGDDTQVGAVVGGGVEYKLASSWSLGLEGLYYFFADDSNAYSITEGDTTYRITEEGDNDVWTVRARVSYHFGGEDGDAPLK